MDAATIAAIAAALFAMFGTAAAIVAAVVALLSFFWKLPDTERRLNDKFTDLSGEVHHIKGMLEGSGISAKPAKEG